MRTPSHDLSGRPNGAAGKSENQVMHGDCRSGHCGSWDPAGSAVSGCTLNPPGLVAAVERNSDLRELSGASNHGKRDRRWRSAGSTSRTECGFHTPSGTVTPVAPAPRASIIVAPITIFPIDCPRFLDGQTELVERPRTGSNGDRDHARCAWRRDRTDEPPCEVFGKCLARRRPLKDLVKIAVRRHVVVPVGPSGRVPKLQTGDGVRRRERVALVRVERRAGRHRRLFRRVHTGRVGIYYGPAGKQMPGAAADTVRVRKASDARRRTHLDLSGAGRWVARGVAVEAAVAAVPPARCRVAGPMPTLRLRGDGHHAWAARMGCCPGVDHR